jgi:hypothetical protein
MPNAFDCLHYYIDGLTWTQFRDPAQSGVIVVSLPEEMPTNESLELCLALQGELSLPLLAYAYTLGGISAEYLWNGIWLLVLAAIQVGTIALCCSAFCRTTVGAFIASYLVTAIVSLGPGLLLVCSSPCGPTAVRRGTGLTGREEGAHLVAQIERYVGLLRRRRMGRGTRAAVSHPAAAP